VSTATWSPVPPKLATAAASDDRTTRHCWRRPAAEYQGMSQSAAAAVPGLSISGTRIRMQGAAAIHSRY
jgi:hypothetical protein